MVRARNAPVRKAPNEQKLYPAWKAIGANELKQRHQIEPTVIAERIWIKVLRARTRSKGSSRPGGNGLSKRTPR
jgi:hypothetical protein